MVSRHGRCARVAVIGAVLLATAAPPASGQVTRLASGRVLGVAPRSASLFTFRAAPLSARAAAGGAQHFTEGYENLITRFLGDIAADSGKTTNVNAVVARYGAGPEPDPALTYQSSFSAADVFTPADAYPPDQPHGNARGCQAPGAVPAGDPPYTWCLTDAQVQQELSQVIAANKLPSNLSAVYFVLLPPGVDVCTTSGAERAGGANPCTDTDYCAYHSVSQARGPVYVVLPYAGVSGCETAQAPNGDPAADSALSLLSHEHSDTLSNPLLAGSGGGGWYEDSNRAEVSDKCSQPDVFGTPLGGGAGAQYNQLINGDNYYLQDEFANADGASAAFDGCEQRPGAANDGVSASADAAPLTYHGGPIIGPHTTYALFWDPSTPPPGFTASSSTVHVGQPVSFTAVAANPSGGLSYEWDFGDGVSVTTSSPGVSHVFRSPGQHTVTLTVVGASGAGRTTQQTIYVYFGPAARISSVAQPVRTGTIVRFDADRSTDPDGTIISWQWRFGDGTGASGPRPRHAYALPGLYTVSLTLFDSNASSVSTSLRLRITAAGRPAGRVLRLGPWALNLRHGRLVLTTGRAVHCTVHRARCIVSATVYVSGRSAGASLRSAIGRVGMIVRFGATAPISVTLNRTGEGLLATRRRLSVELVVVVRGRGANPARVAFIATLRAPARLRR